MVITGFIGIYSWAEKKRDLKKALADNYVGFLDYLKDMGRWETNLKYSLRPKIIVIKMDKNERI